MKPIVEFVFGMTGMAGDSLWRWRWRLQDKRTSAALESAGFISRRDAAEDFLETAASIANAAAEVRGFCARADARTDGNAD